MKTLEKRKINTLDIEDVIEFYNSSAEEFYRGAFIFMNEKDFANKFKSDLLYLMVEYERVIKTSFHTNRYLENINLKRFKQMFPNLCTGIFKINTYDDAKKLGVILNYFRNLNAHSIPSFLDFKVFKEDFSGLKKQPVLNNKIRYLTDNDKLTVAGLIFIIMNLGRAQSVKSLTTKDEKFGLISKGTMGEKDDGTYFVNNISHVDWEIKIRDDDKKSIPGAIFGDLLEKARTEQNWRYALQIGKDEYFDMKLEAKITSDMIVVSRKSLTNVFYSKEYTLKVIDKDHFIELANQFPSFIFVDLLYKLGITQFDQKTYEKLVLEKNWNLYSKLMYPKFYSDKNIDILLADRKMADLRINSNVCNGALQAIFMKLEKQIIRNCNIDLKNMSYSRLVDLFSQIGVPRQLTIKIQTLRNLVSHGYIIGEYTYAYDEYTVYDLTSVCSRLCELLDFFKTYNETIFNFLSQDISLLFINQMLSVKTKLYIRESLTYINNYPNSTNIDELKKKSAFFDNSSYPVTLFKDLNKKVNGILRAIKIKLKGLDVDLVVLNNIPGKLAIDTLLSKTQSTIVDDTNDGVYRYLTLG